MKRGHDIATLTFGDEASKQMTLMWRYTESNESYLFVTDDPDAEHPVLEIYLITKAVRDSYQVKDLASAIRWDGLLRIFCQSVRPHHVDPIDIATTGEGDEQARYVLHGIYQVDEREFMLYFQDEKGLEEDDEPGQAVVECIVDQGRIQIDGLDDDELIAKVLSTAGFLESEERFANVFLERDDGSGKEEMEILEIVELEDGRTFAALTPANAADDDETPVEIFIFRYVDGKISCDVTEVEIELVKAELGIDDDDIADPPEPASESITDELTPEAEAALSLQWGRRIIGHD